MNRKIIVAPLNWGLGHASRCVPIIIALIHEGFTPVIASDGEARRFLMHEFPALETIELPSYNIKYGKNLKRELFLQVPAILRAVIEERKIIKQFVAKDAAVIGVLSDNRFGVRSNAVVSVYITHQLTIFSGFTTFIASKIHQLIISTFDVCWIPDTAESTFSGKLSTANSKINKQFIGILSRFKKTDVEHTIDVLIVLSGPEPNRTLFEKKMLLAFKEDTRNVVFVLGKVEKVQKNWTLNNCTFYNFLLTKELQEKINAAAIVICRSGYSSIMDLAVLGKKVYFIPTKNQPEQEYLACYFQEKKVAPFSTIENFTIDKLKDLNNYTGLSGVKTPFNTDLFCLFHRK